MLALYNNTYTHTHTHTHTQAHTHPAKPPSYPSLKHTHSAMPHPPTHTVAFFFLGGGVFFLRNIKMNIDFKQYLEIKQERKESVNLFSLAALRMATVNLNMSKIHDYQDI